MMSYDAIDRRVAGQYFDVKWDYSYDQYNQLTGAKNSEGNSYQYTYDSIENRLKAVENETERNFTYNKLNQISNTGYSYDAWGNMTKTPEAEYAYDLKNRLIKVVKSDGTVIEYIYDAMDQRIGSKISDKEISFLMSGMIEYARNDGEVQYHTLGLDIVGSLGATGATGSILASGDQDFLYDGNGNVIAAAKEGTITDSLAYEPFGKQTSNVDLPFTFSSKYADESGLSYYGFRFYDPVTSRWEKRDPLLDDVFEKIQLSINEVNKSSLLAKISRDFFMREIILDDLRLRSFYEFADNNPTGNIDNKGLQCIPSDCAKALKVKEIASLEVTVTKTTGFCAWNSNAAIASQIKDAFIQQQKTGEAVDIDCKGKDASKCPCKCDSEPINKFLDINEDNVGKKDTCTFYYHMTGRIKFEGEMGKCIGQK